MANTIHSLANRFLEEIENRGVSSGRPRQLGKRSQREDCLNRIHNYHRSPGRDINPDLSQVFNLSETIYDLFPRINHSQKSVMIEMKMMVSLFCPTWEHTYAPLRCFQIGHFSSQYFSDSI